MSEEKKTSTEVSKVEAEGGRIIFADEVVATIAALAVSDVDGVSSLSGGVVEGITEMLGKKNVTKGVKVEVGTEEAAVDVSVSIKYGYKIKEVCEKIQQAAKSAVETMTGLRVGEINVFVQSVHLEPSSTGQRQKRETQRKSERERSAARCGRSC